MKRSFIILFLVAMTMHVYAQKDSTSFKGYLYNEEYQVYIDMDFYNNLSVPGQEIFGKLPGYFGAKRDTRKWLFTSVKIKNPKTAKIGIINDYGSEDLNATLTKNDQNSYTFTQDNGSSIKIAVNRKWVKIPSKIIFTRITNKK